MEILRGAPIRTHIGTDGLVEADWNKIRTAQPTPVNSFIDLVKKVAEIQFANPSLVFLFRGQDKDYRRTIGTTLKRSVTTVAPSILRGQNGSHCSKAELKQRFEKLEKAESFLLKALRAFDSEHYNLVARNRLVRWSIIQHYEIAATPLLDVTHSLRIAASFGTKPKQRYGHVVVLGVPGITGGITVSAEAGLQVVRLSSVCPSNAVRPFIQEGYLLGDYPDINDAIDDDSYKLFEVDFYRRMVAKFRFEPSKFWADGKLEKVSNELLYPDEEDEMVSICAKIASKLKKIA